MNRLASFCGVWGLQVFQLAGVMVLFAFSIVLIVIASIGIGAGTELRSFQSRIATTGRHTRCFCPHKETDPS